MFAARSTSGSASRDGFDLIPPVVGQPTSPPPYVPYPVPSHVKLTDVEMEVFRPSEAEFGICRISIDRQRRKNAFRPETVEDLIAAFRMAEDDPQIGCIILQGKGKDFCAGGDQVRVGVGVGA